MKLTVLAALTIALLAGCGTPNRLTAVPGPAPATTPTYSEGQQAPSQSTAPTYSEGQSTSNQQTTQPVYSEGR